MKEIKNNSKKSILSKLLAKFSRLLGYEIIDQNNFELLASGKHLNTQLTEPGKKSIVMPLGEVKITRKVKALDIIIRTCASVKMLTQNKERIFEKEKIEYTLRTIKSIIKGIKLAQETLPVKFKLIVIDHESSDDNLEKIRHLIKNSSIENEIINLDVNEFKEQMNTTNKNGKQSTDNQLSNMANIFKSLVYAKNNAQDLIYFIEDDYLHKVDAIKEFVLAYERIASQINNELIICPADYPYLYAKADKTNILLGEKYHWRKIDESLCSFLTSKNLLEKHWGKFTAMCKQEHYPFESPLHDIYSKELCISPIPSLAVHFTNVNSIFGLSPHVDWKKIWDENE